MGIDWFRGPKISRADNSSVCPWDIGRMRQLTSLAPDIIESILAGQNYADISLRHCRKGVPVLWDGQRRFLGQAE